MPLPRLCQYKDIFGKPNVGFHSIRIFDFALLDILGTILIAFIISKYYKINFVFTTIILFLVAIFMHWLFCVNTKLNTLLGL
jgi:uncharacterized membrane protein YcaP (DUF421 family)